MTVEIYNIRTIELTMYPYIFEQNVSVPLSAGGMVRCNVYRPKDSEDGTKYPVIATLGPYGKDVPYKEFNPKSFSEVNPEHQTEHSAWETPTPKYWTEQGYVVVRADEIGTGQSPGMLNVLSAATIDAFCNLIEWASDQPWSTGRVGLLGVSYYAAIQWQVAARNPRGLAACIPWEGFSDPINESVRHGGILSNGFFEAWHSRQVAPNQYGLPGKAARNWGPDTVEGNLSPTELAANRIDVADWLSMHKFRDDAAFRSTNFNFEDIKVPILSVANWGGVMLHLRGNVRGFIFAASEFKYLRFIVGRHDLPFYYPEEVEVQRSFLDAFLKDEDAVGWSKKGAVPAVNLILRKGNPGFNDPAAEKVFARRTESAWPIPRTKYTDLFLTQSGILQFDRPDVQSINKVSYQAMSEKTLPPLVSFQTKPFESETEITGHIVAHLNVSVSRDRGSTTPSDIDLFLSIRHISPTGAEVLYTGSIGGGVPVSKGFLRVSQRKTNPQHNQYRSWMPFRDYFAAGTLPVIPDEVYTVDVEIRPTNVVVEVGGRLVLEVSSQDTAGSELWVHTDPKDRSPEVFRGTNSIHFGPHYSNYLTVPIIPPVENE